MFIFTARLTRKKIAAGIGAVGVLLVAVILLISQSGRAETVGAIEASPKNIKTAEQRVVYLSSLGWTVSADTEQVQEVMIPEEFGEVFANYNELQKAQGFDLEKYKGKRVTRYIYDVTNHPTDTCVYATLLVYKNTIIGGDIQCPKLNGFMHGLIARTGVPQTLDGADAE